MFLRKSADALDLLTEAKLLRRFRPPRRDLSSLYAGYYIAELLDELTQDHDPLPPLFDVALDSLDALAQGAAVATTVLRFELVALHHVGHLPSLATCTECGRGVPATGRLYFGCASGGVLCAECRPGKTSVLLLSAGTLRVLERFADLTSDAWRRIEWDRQVQGELRGAVNHYLWHLLGRPPRMRGFLGILSS